MAINGYTGIKVFSATKSEDRNRIGEAVSAWLAANRNVEVVDTEVRQSSDQSFHCMSITVFYRQKAQTAQAA